MSNFRAGLYSFASTSIWLHGTGVASPPFLVMLGLTLPDSRILSGIAGIGLTLANIAFILPHLRQPIIDSMHAHKAALAREQDAQRDIGLSDGFNATQQVISDAFTLISTCDGEHQTLPLTRSSTVQSICSAVTGPMECLGIDPEAVPCTILLPPVIKTDDSQITVQISRSPDANFSEKHPDFGRLLVREGRDPLHIPLPVPDAVEVAFFDTTDANVSLAVCEQQTIHKGHSTLAIDGPVDGKDNQLITANLPVTSTRAEAGGDHTDMAVPIVVGKDVAPPTTKDTLRNLDKPVAEGAVSHPSDDLAVCGVTTQRVQARRPLVGGKEAPTKRRPESLVFVPQSVISRYPSAPTASAGHCLGHRAFRPNHQVTPTSPHILVHDPAMQIEGTRPWAGHTTIQGSWCASFLTEVHPKRQSAGEQTFVKTTLTQGPIQQGSLGVHELTPRKYPTQRRRLDVLARAVLRNRKSAVRRYRNDVVNGFPASDSDSESDSDSQYSSGSSSDEDLLPHILGADLIAAIDANSESGLNLAGSKVTTRTPLDVYGDFLASEGSAADVSMMMHVSANDDTSDSEVGAPATFRLLTYEDIQQWASGVVQKCVRQVCRSRIPVEPSSPSQASDVCAERPSGSGISQCPLSGLHCKLGVAALAEVPMAKNKELSILHPPTSTLQNRRLLPVRNLRDIPEFVPRQRHVSMITQGVECPRRIGTKSTIDVTRDAAIQMIARMEGRVGFHARQRFVGSGEKGMVSTAGSWRGTQRCPL